MGDTRQGFAEKVLRGLGFADAGPSVDVLVAVMAGEDTAAEWNPCATEEDLPGDSNFNFDGVKDYDTEAEGVEATVGTLKNGKYGAVLVELAANSDAQAGVIAWAVSGWGTFDHNPTTALDVLLTVQANRGAAYGVEVTGPEPVEAAPVKTEPAPAPDQTVEPQPGPTQTAESPGSTPAPAPPPEEVTVSVSVPQLQNGSSGPSVRSVQILLNEKFAASPPLATDGEYGPVTESTVKEFQTVHHITVDGIAGPQTWGVLLN
jgi:murein L,D-transpeptidase YcbB/YkuD